MVTPKEELRVFLEQQRDDSSLEQIVREIALHVMVKKGLADSDATRTASNDEMGRRIRSLQS